jgi:hypothetical protein
MSFTFVLFFLHPLLRFSSGDGLVCQDMWCYRYDAMRVCVVSVNYLRYLGRL